MSSELVQWVEALGVWAAVVVALFGEALLKHFRQPRLKVQCASPHLSVQKTQALASRGDGVTVPYPCYYCHLEIANEGAVAARDVEVFVSGVYRLGQNGWVVEDLFIPQWLLWATIRNVARDSAPGIYLPTLAPGSRRIVDLAHVHSPKYRGLFPGEGRDGAAVDKTLLSLDVAVFYLRAGHLLDPGTYMLTLEVSAANASPKVFEVEIRHTGDWYDNEEEMRRSGVIIGPVRSIPASGGGRATIQPVSTVPCVPQPPDQRTA